MLEMASLGAKVLEIRSVSFARLYRVPLRVRSTFSNHPGTLVCEEDEEMEGIPVSGVAFSRNEARVSITRVPDRPGIAMRFFQPVAEANVVVDLIIQNTSIDGLTDLTFTVPKGDLPRTLEVVNAVAQEIGADRVLSDEEHRQGLHRGGGHAQQRRRRLPHVRRPGPGRHQHHDDQHLGNQNFLRHRGQIYRTGGAGAS
jgi:aspartate kinase